ncbi:MAG: hypothetical protein GWO02_01790, partial [Gammaproteobacteria bacterium]|nr:hypothetical protein [Gammaproteobacteria bacterium]
GIAAWAAAACVWPDTSRLLRIQVLVLVACGVGALTFAFGAGDVRPAVGEVLSRNTTLLGMLVAVTFLRLITLPASGARTLPRGVGAFARTAVGV